MEKILFVCTAPGLESYSIGLITAAFGSKVIDPYVCVFIDASDQRTKPQLQQDYNLQNTAEHKALFLQLPANKVKRIFSSGSYLDQVAAFAVNNDIKKIHFISQDVILWGYLHKFKNFHIYYTVHDLHPHEVKLGMLQKLKHWYFRIRKDQRLIANIQNLITNSIHQEQELKSRYPLKKVYLHQMPGLITPAINAGVAEIKELSGMDQYVLFFGKIELYKGLHILYEAFQNNDELQQTKLVIAGKGNIYFKRVNQMEQNVRFINRYICDSEINSLFSKASVFIMPYTSATQSAVTSLPYHYGIPVIASAIPALEETVIPGETGLTFSVGDAEAMSAQILKLLKNHDLYHQMSTAIKYRQPFYNPEILCKQLEEIYR